MTKLIIKAYFFGEKNMGNYFWQVRFIGLGGGGMVDNSDENL